MAALILPDLYPNSLTLIAIAPGLFASRMKENGAGKSVLFLASLCDKAKAGTKVKGLGCAASQNQGAARAIDIADPLSPFWPDPVHPRWNWSF